MLKRLVLVIFPLTFSFDTILEFRLNLRQNHATLCIRQLFLMILSLRIFKCSVMGYNSYTKVLLVNMPIEKSLFGLRQFGPNLCKPYPTLYLMIHYLRIFSKFCGILRQKRQTNSLTHFPKKLLLPRYRPNLAQNNMILYQKHSHQPCQLIFQKNSFLDQHQFGQSWCNLILLI